MLGQNEGMTWSVERLRLVLAVAAVGIALLAIVTLGWAVARGILFVTELFEGDWADTVNLVRLLQIVDLFLVATVLVLVALGIWKLFVRDIPLPDWLVIEDMGDLKRPVVQVLIVVLAIKFLEIAIENPAVDVLFYGAGTALVMTALIFFNVLIEGVVPQRGARREQGDSRSRGE